MRVALLEGGAARGWRFSGVALLEGGASWGWRCLREAPLEGGAARGWRWLFTWIDDPRSWLSKPILVLLEGGAS